MSIDKKSKQTISNILSAFIGEEPVTLYQEVAKRGISSTKIQELELTRNREDLASFSSFSPFNKLTKDIRISDDKKLKKFHSEIMETLRDKKQVEVPAKKLNALLSNNNVFKNIGEAMTSLVTEQSSFSPECVDKAVLFSKNSKNTELLKSYLLLKNEKIETSSIQLLSKGLRNVENPEMNRWIPTELIQSVGMVQIGLALKDLATTPVERNKGEKRKQQEIKIRNYAQSGSHSSTEFLTSCKLFARQWEERNISTLLELVDKQKKKQEKADALLNKVDESYSPNNTKKNKQESPKKKQRARNAKP